MAKMLEPIPPGEILLEEFLKPLGISQNRLARDLGVPVARMNEIIKGKRALTADTALRLHRYFGVSAEFWMNLQAHYDLRMAKRDLWPAIKTRIRARAAA
jgi:addiction module HigA family antidote